MSLPHHHIVRAGAHIALAAYFVVAHNEVSEPVDRLGIALAVYEAQVRPSNLH